MSASLGEVSHHYSNNVDPFNTMDVGAKGDNTNLHLRRFVDAKHQIGGIYKELLQYIQQVLIFLQNASSVCASAPINEFNQTSESIVTEATQRIDRYVEKVTAILSVLDRDHMKVVFFGRTSNGKSTVINALLGENILPTGIGHTTSCFLQVEGGNTSEPYVMTEDSTEKKPIKSIGSLGNALCEQKLEPNAKIRIVRPKHTCQMLESDVVLIDSPGIDVETDLDEWIDKFCLDSDVFVLVANSESTLMLTEKKFFHRVSERLSRPNIFIVHNRSDAFAGEENQSEVRHQHMERALKFLIEELRICAKEEEADGRIFFVSAKEALKIRIQEAKGLPPQIATADYIPRFEEFRSFENNFADCLSKTAVKTKFQQHASRGEQVVQDVGETLTQVHSVSLAQTVDLRLAKKELWDRCDFVTKQLDLITLDMKDKIRSITEDVEYKVGKAMSEEIRRLSVLVDDFNDPFHPDPLVVNVYKSRLHHHVESGIGSNLKSRLSTELQLNVEAHEQEMIQRMTALLPAEKQQLSRNIIPRRDNFEVFYHLHFENLCADFQEDIRFRFSYGLGSLFQRLVGQNRKSASPRHQLSSSQSHSPVNEMFLPPDDLSIVSKVAVAAMTSQGTMGGLLVGGLLLKTVGWRFIFVTGGLYAALYLYERLTWTDTAKCKEFKRQYVEHAARKLRLVVDMTSANSAHQIQQELSSTFARLCRLVDETTSDMRENMLQIDKTLKELEEITNKSKELRKQVNSLENKFSDFDQTYLQ